MKLKLLMFLALITVVNVFAQTTIHNIDDCIKKPFDETGNGLTATLSEPIPGTSTGYTATNVSLLTPSANNSGYVKLNLPFSINADDEFTFKLKINTASAGASGSGSGQIQVRFYNRTVGIDGASSYRKVSFDKDGGLPWQQLSATTTITGRTDSGGGAITTFDAIQILPVVSAVTTEPLYFDDFTIEDHEVDLTSDLLTGNGWWDNNSPDEFNVGYITKRVSRTVGAAAPADGLTQNNSPTVLKISETNASSSYIKFTHGAINSTTGKIKFRIYPECITGDDSKIKVTLRKDNSTVTQLTTNDVFVTTGVWNDIELDLSTLTGNPTDNLYTETFLFLSNGVVGATFYVDAFQGPAFTSTYTDGAANILWSNASNWDNGVPHSAINAVIPDGFNTVIGVTGKEVVHDLTMQGSGKVSVNVGGSLIVNGSSSGEVIYQRTLTAQAADADGWHLISSPVAGQVYNNAYATTNDLATSTTDGTRRGLATYNDANDPKFDYLLTTDANAGTFTSGIGYSAKIASTDKIAFTGTINTEDVNGVVVSASADEYVLLGVPYTSYMSSKTFLEANTNLDQSQIWIWEPGVTGGNYEAKVAGNDFIIAPGQGFFVKKSSVVATVNFAESNQTSNDTDTFKKSSKTEVKLLLSDGENNRFAKLNYANNVTKGFDTGWEGETFGGVKNSFDVFSQLVEDNQGKNYQVQSLPLSEIESMIVPLGIKAAANKEITFSVETLNLPTEMKVILEDRTKNVFTNLNEGDYKITLTDAANGVGRFYLHTSTKSALSVDDNLALNSISIFKSSASTLKIAGLQQGNASVKLYNILGKQVLKSSFVASGVKDIALPNLATGVYVVQLQTEAGTLNKKIILE